MQTIKKLKALIGYEQTDEVFKEYLLQLESAGVITISEGDINDKEISDELYENIASIYGVFFEDEQNSDDIVEEGD